MKVCLNCLSFRLFCRDNYHQILTRQQPEKAKVVEECHTGR